MYIKFLEDTFHPKRNSLYPDYREGEVCDLSEEDAEYFLREGMVVRLESPPEATEGEIDFPNTSL